MNRFNNNLKYIFTAIFLINLSILYSQVVKVQANFDSTKIKIGDQIKFRFEVEQPGNAKVQIPVLENIGENKEIEILQAFPPDTVKNGSTLKIKQEFLVTSFDSGSFVFPPIKVPFENGALKDTLVTSPLQLTVLSLPTDTVTQVLDIKPPMRTPITLAEIWPYLLGLFILFIIILELIAYSKRSKNSVTGIPFKITEPAHIFALRELDNLRAQKLWQSNQVKLYYVRLTEIIRTYIENRFGILALEMTSDELIMDLRKVLFNEDESVKVLHKLLNLADLVKFAKTEPLPNENEVSLLTAYQFVNNTKQIVLQASDTNNTEFISEVQQASSELNTEINEPLVGTEKKESAGYPKVELQSNISIRIPIWLKFILLIKRIGILYRLVILIASFYLLAGLAIPDLLFIIKRNNTTSFTIEEIRNLSEIPRYLSLKDAVIPEKGMLQMEITHKKTGTKTLGYVLFAVNTIGSDAPAYILIKDSKIKEEDLKSKGYFNPDYFKIEGRYDGEKVTGEMLQLFSEQGVTVDPKAIIIEKGAEPMSMAKCILLSLVSLVLIALLLTSFVPKNKLEIFFSKNIK